MAKFNRLGGRACVTAGGWLEAGTRMNPGILVVAAERQLRRSLFDAFDRAAYPHIHSARDMAHAAILLEGRPSLQLVVMVFNADQAQAESACDQLRRLPGCLDAPLIAVLANEASISPGDLPATVEDWLYATQIDSELVPRWQRARVNRPVPDLGPESTAGTTRHDYRYAFDESDSEWLVIDASDQRLLQVSPAVARHTQLHVSQWQGLTLPDVLQFDAVAVEKALAEADGSWYACQRKSALGTDGGEVSVRRTRHHEHDALALLFRSDRADQRAEMALALLSRINTSMAGVDAQVSAGRLLFDALGLDYLAVWPARANGAQASAPVLQLCSDDDPVYPPPSVQSSLHRALGGKAMLHRVDARRLATTDPLVQQLELAGFAALPIYDERCTVLGAMLAGSRKGFGDMEIIEPLLLCAAARFGQLMELTRAREQGRAEVLMDALTGLPNRLLFGDRLETIIREATRNGECFAVVSVNLDRFSAVNESHGHAAGDQVLKVVSQRLCGGIRASDTVARYAGDEFAVVLRHIVKNDDVSRIAEKLMQIVEAPLHLADGNGLALTVSMGLSFFPDDASDAPSLLKHADEAMVAAKRLGGSNVQVYVVSPEYAREHGVALKTRLRHAESNGELRVVYQPQVDAVTEDIVGMEALLRWEHPELGLISPAVFIPLAEETGLIISIGEWVLRTACRQAQEWQRRYQLRLRLGVNLSAVQLMEPQLLEMVTRALRDTRLDPGLLELEITESVSIKAAPNLVENLQGLHKLGCHIAIDDFGTGAASLDYLRRLPADRIKIDQSFVRNIGVDPDDEAIVRATIDMAHRLKRAVVAEGVEIEQHLQFLRAHHCDELQGYLFCRPLQPVSFDKLLAERERLLDGSEVVPA
jgi:diguanylate cyclase (GGDEF)-like protein